MDVLLEAEVNLQKVTASLPCSSFLILIIPLLKLKKPKQAHSHPEKVPGCFYWIGSHSQVGAPGATRINL